MTGERSLFSQFEEKDEGSVTFGDGNAARIAGRGTIDVSGLPKLTDFLYVQGLKHNLLSINQICDKGYAVHFTQGRCDIKDKKANKTLVRGIRTSDNCYVIDPEDTSHNTCLVSHANETKLWH